MSSRHSLIVRIHSGLGNQMFQYAFGLCLSERMGFKLLLDTSFYPEYDPVHNMPQNFQLDLFQLNYVIADKYLIDKVTKNLYPKIYRGLSKLIVKNGLIWRGPGNVVAIGNSVKSIERLVVDRDVYLNGYWASDRYFSNCCEKVARAFQLKESNLRDVNQKLLMQIQQNESVSLHVRRGSYLKIGYFHELPMTYYNRAVEIIVRQKPNARLFVFSDDPEWVRTNMRFSIPTTYIEDINPGHIDMYYMSQCKHNIIANSTFSWWGAYLNMNKVKIVIAPSRWTNNKKEQARLEKYCNLYPKDWIVL